MDWDVFVVAGPSGVGKSRLSYPLARYFGVPITEVDDLFRAVEAATTPNQQPSLHFWRTGMLGAIVGAVLQSHEQEQQRRAMHRSERPA